MFLFSSVSAFAQEEITSTPKQPGTVRIGVVLTKLQLGPEQSDAAAAAAIRDVVMETLKGPTVEVVVIESRSATNAAIEAAQKDCDYLLFTDVSKKTRKSLIGGIVKAAAPALVGQIPGAGIVSESTAGIEKLKHSAADGGKEYVESTLASSFGAKDELSFEFTLVLADGRTVAAKGSSAAKVKSDGENVLTRLIEQNVEKMLLAVMKK